MMKSYREQNAYVKSYENLSKWSFIFNCKGKVTITIMENGIERTYHTEITFGTIHGREGIKGIGVHTRFGQTQSGIDIDIFENLQTYYYLK